MFIIQYLKCYDRCNSYWNRDFNKACDKCGSVRNYGVGEENVRCICPSVGRGNKGLSYNNTMNANASQPCLMFMRHK